MNAIDNAINAKMHRYSFLTSMELLREYKELVLSGKSEELKAVEQLIYDRMKGEYEGDHFRDATEMMEGELTVEDIEAFLAEYDEQEEVDTKWTPCSEALPKIGEEVLVTRRFLGVSNLKPYEYVTIAMLNFIDDNGDQNWVCESDKYRVLRHKHTLPIAWMPLPKPYEKEGE